MLCDDFIATTLHSRRTVHFINVKLEQQTCNTCGLNTARALVYYNQKQQSVSDTQTYTHNITYIRTHLLQRLSISLSSAHEHRYSE